MGQVGLGGILFDDLSMDEAVDRLMERVKRKEPTMVVTPNATILHKAFHDDAFFDLLSKATFILPDGVGVTLAARALKTPFRHPRIAGVAFGEAVLKRAAKEGVRVAFFGGKEGVAEAAKARFSAKYKGLSVVYTRSGYDFSLDRVKEELSKSGASVVFVCLGSPLQEEVSEALADELSLASLALGGSLDIYAGKLRRAPRLFRALGLEWLYRMLREPRRFRGVVTLVRFAFDLLRLKREKRACNRHKRGL